MSSAVFRAIAPQFIVPDVGRSVAHYRDVLGFSIQSTLGDPPIFAMLVRGGVILQLARSDTGEVSPNARLREGLGFDAYIWVDGLDGLARDLAEKGARIVEGPVRRAYGMTEIIVEDPDGYRLALGEPADR
jgi:catechol 2,3-dioxygenase-like lactoylglutathione lyase family enzyme